MQTITFTKRSVMNRLHVWRDELNHIGRGVGTFVAVPGTVLEYVGFYRDDPADRDVVSLVGPKGPYVGQAATICVGTDRHPATVIAVSPSGSKVTVRQDRAIRVDDNGMSDSQSYRFEEDPAGEVRTFHRGAFDAYRSRGYILRLGERSAFYDYTR